jgi:hypothetical protein
MTVHTFLLYLYFFYLSEYGVSRFLNEKVAVVGPGEQTVDIWGLKKITKVANIPSRPLPNH